MYVDGWQLRANFCKGLRRRSDNQIVSKATEAWAFNFAKVLKMRTKWQIHYSDESIVEGVTQADWVAAPATGVLVTVEVFEAIYGTVRQRHACQRWAGVDFYWMRLDGRLDGGLASAIPAGAIAKAGELVSAAVWEFVYNRAQQDPLYVCAN